MTPRIAAGMLVAALTGCATAETRPSAAVTSLAPDAQRSFRISWEVEGGDRERRLRGYLENTSGEPVTRIQVLGQALDVAGNVIGQRLEWVPGAIPAFGRGYFEISKMPPADRYRVTVWAYDRVRGPTARLQLPGDSRGQTSSSSTYSPPVRRSTV